MTAAICIVGSKNAGKTTLIERLLPELAARGRRVATIKHDAHDFEIDLPGKDTWRHRQAGSGTTIIASSSKVAMVRLTEREAGLDDLKRLITFVETDRCGTDAVQTVTGCTLGKRTLKFVDYGKLAATFLDTETGRAVRVCALESAREAALRFAPEERDPHQAQLRAYKALPNDELFTVAEVRVTISEADLPGCPRGRAMCEACGEGVSDGRDVSAAGRTLCRACARGAYYTLIEAETAAAVRA